MKTTFIAIAASLCLLTALPGQVAALSPPIQPKGEVVFANGGRVISIKADGSERKVLTRKDVPVSTRNFEREFLELGDSDPSISPDGEMLAFIRATPFKKGYRHRLMVAARDGSGARKVVSYGNSYIGSLDWTPANRLLISLTAFEGKDRKGNEIYQQRLMTMDPDGDRRRKLIITRPAGFLETPWLTAQSFSPDGTSLLYTRANMKQTELRLRNIQTGKDRRVTFGAEEAAFSPDGNTIVLTPARCFRDEGKGCGGSKWLKQGLWTIQIDGTGLKRLMSDPTVSSPSYSPDGDRILFASSRNAPGRDEAAHEIYSVTSEGKCLTWLTNGSPASISPSFGPEADASYSPGRCGSAGREPLVEIKPPPARKSDPRPRLWAGPEVGGRLLSSLVSYWGGPNEFYVYGDCGYFNPDRCSRSLAIETIPACGVIEEIDFGDRFRKTRKRGVPVFTGRNSKRPGATLVASGKSAYAIGETFLFDDESGKPNTFADHVEMINQLRPVGKPLVPGSKLPARIKVNCRR